MNLASLVVGRIGDSVMGKSHGLVAVCVCVSAHVCAYAVYSCSPVPEGISHNLQYRKDAKRQLRQVTLWS